MMEKLVQSFEGLLRRGIAPSVTFFVIAALGDFIRIELGGESPEARLQTYLEILGHKSFAVASVFIAFSVLVITGFSYGLLAIQQVLFDNWQKENFDPWFPLGSSVASEDRALTELRSKVTQRLRTEPDLKGLADLKEVTDYVLYEILGGIDTVDTRGFVDSAKAMGIVFVSLIIVLIGNALLYHQQLGPWSVLLVLLAVVFYVWGRETTVAQYRARALRLYVNFLAMPTERIRRRLLWPDEAEPPAENEKKDT